ncbi:glycosyl transferase family 4 [Candidatus Woesearchaeota archaeon]|nr:glycosyl transferase family 4 [Candidatus Woesearchaeota archaeon]
MVQSFLILCFVVSFLITLLVTPGWIRRARKAGLVGIDMHKLNPKNVAEMGGVPVLIGFMAGVLLFIAINTYYLDAPQTNLQILALLSTILTISIIGIIDDILGWKIGLRQWQKPLLTFFAALPMVVVNAGYSKVSLPLLGIVDLTYIYPFLFIPIGIVGASNGFNMLAGYNGLETGMGAIILFTMGYIAWFTRTGWVAVVALCMFSSLIALYLFNRHPARIFPGDTLTYSVGALIASVAIAGNMEKIALFLFIPYFIQFPLKLRGLMQKESFAKLLPNGSLLQPYKKIYALEHLIIYTFNKLNIEIFEKDLVRVLFLFEIGLSAIVIYSVTYKIGIF